MSAALYNFSVIVALLFSSICLRQAVIFAGQHWIRNASHSITLLILPIITYVITSVISGNIALSLGMVGALSIVRFRNPVKSPFELAVYFLMITAGISAGVNLEWLLLLMVTTIAIIVGVEAFNRLYFRLTQEHFFRASFSEGNSLSTLEIKLSNANASLRQSQYLIQFIEGPESSSYRFAAVSGNELSAIADAVREDDRNAEIQFAST